MTSTFSTLVACMVAYIWNWVATYSERSSFPSFMSPVVHELDHSWCCTSPQPVTFLSGVRPTFLGFSSAIGPECIHSILHLRRTIRYSLGLRFCFPVVNASSTLGSPTTRFTCTLDVACLALCAPNKLVFSMSPSLGRLSRLFMTYASLRLRVNLL